jgi:4-azaleucine resistance transporter AzlC
MQAHALRGAEDAARDLAAIRDEDGHHVPRLSPQRAALAEGWPVLVTVLVVGTTFGIVARQSGLAPAEVMAMSLLVFAGAAQFAMLQLFKDGVAWPVVAATVLLINLRHLLMAAALRPYFAGVSTARRLAAAFVLTDEAFAMAIGWFRRGRTELGYYATFAVALYVLWNTATVIGMLVGPSIGEPRRLGVDFAITATFIAIVVLGVRRRSDAIVALVAALLASALAFAGASVIAVVAAGALAPLLVLFIQDEEPAS